MERTVTIRTELESILVDQALAMARELEAVANAAPDGEVLAVAELAALRSGRELTRRGLEAALQQQAKEAEKKGLWAEPVRAADNARSKTKRPKQR